MTINCSPITMSNKQTTYSSSASVINQDDIKRAMQMILDQGKQPRLECIKSKLEYIDLLKKSYEARTFHLLGGIRVIQDETIPKDMMRFSMSDGSYHDVPVNNLVKYLNSDQTK